MHRIGAAVSPESRVQSPESSKDEPHVAHSSREEALALDQVSFTYADTTIPALREVSLQIRQGEMVVIMGASGAGKSTLAKCLNRVIPAFQNGQFTGEVRLFDKRLAVEKVGELAETIGMVFQDFEAQLFSTTVRDEVAFGLEQLGVEPAEMHHRLTTALAQVGLSGFEERDPTTLSGGQKQRLAIAALLALRPRVLVFDEPTTDLDPEGRQEIFTLLGQMRTQGHTLVVIEHEITAALEADRLLILAAGAIVADGPPHELLPHVEMLEHYGIKPHDCDRLFPVLGVREYPRKPEAAATLLQQHSPAESLTVPSQEQHENQQQPLLLSLHTISHTYADGPSAVQQVSLTIGEGEFIALLGKNGSGKTTLAKHISGLLVPTHGQVLLRGKELSTLPLVQVAQEVSYVFQNPDHQLFAETVEAEVAFGPQNIGLTSEEVRSRVDEALTAVGLQHVREQDPFLLGRGERQRLAVAALLSMRPRVLILDEPTTGLDYREQRQMMELLKQLHRDGRTLIIITHVPWVAVEYAERALLMSAGRLLWDGPMRSMCAQPELCAQAAFRPPDVTLIGRKFGVTPLSVEELLTWIHNSSQERTFQS
ncbi:MAG: ABC transporter ATP-binding protein [Deltaproteobacteria bacterium]|nr:ABC transporter ATP-binding protein [Deltaproteobacteria bacterium]